MNKPNVFDQAIAAAELGKAAIREIQEQRESVLAEIAATKSKAFALQNSALSFTDMEALFHRDVDVLAARFKELADWGGLMKALFEPIGRRPDPGKSFLADRSASNAVYWRSKNRERPVNSLDFVALVEARGGTKFLLHQLAGGDERSLLSLSPMCTESHHKKWFDEARFCYFNGPAIKAMISEELRARKTDIEGAEARMNSGLSAEERSLTAQERVKLSFELYAHSETLEQKLVELDQKMLELPVVCPERTAAASRLNLLPGTY